MTTRAVCTAIALAIASFAPSIASANAAFQEPPPGGAPPAPTDTATPPANPPSGETPAPTPAPEATPPAPVPAPAVVPPPPLPPVDLTPPLESQPLAGFSDGTAFLRSPDNMFILFPNGRLQTDGYFFKSDNAKGVPNNTFLIKRARLEMNGWIGPMVYFSIAGDLALGPPAAADPTAPANLVTTDDYVAIAPWGDRAILQFGQFDAPFTLENRTSDKYFDFMERSITVRAFGIPSNKEMGAMLHGTTPERLFYYSLAVINGDGQNFKNVDTKFDVMGRGWIAPFAFGGPEMLRAITVGGSFWQGWRVDALPIASQTTEAGFTFFSPKWTSTTTPATTYELHQDRHLEAAAIEANIPIAHKYGARWEFVWKRQPFTAEDVTGGKAPTPVSDGGKLQGWSTYGELWYWVMGDDRIIGEPGMQMPTRFKKFGVKPPQCGLMLVARLDYLDETVTDYAGTAALSGASALTGSTKVTSFNLGANYWFSKRFRATFNYGFNSFGGDNATVSKLKSEQEFLFRLAIAL